MIDYMIVGERLTDIALIFIILGVVSKIRILIAPIKVPALINMTKFMEETLLDEDNKNIIDTYLEKKYDLKKDENGQCKYILKQIEEAIKVNKKSLNIDEDKYMKFLSHIAIVNTINWFSKNSIKLGFKILFVCICIAAGQATVDIYHSISLK